jgi:hypothetical protein
MPLQPTIFHTLLTYGRGEIVSWNPAFVGMTVPGSI